MPETTTDIEQMRLKHSQDQEVWSLLDEVESLRSEIAEWMSTVEGVLASAETDSESLQDRMDLIIELAREALDG